MPKINKSKTDEFLDTYNQYGDAIFRYCFYKTSNREQALDLVQETFSKTWEYMAKGKKVGNLKAFLYKTANNLIIDWFRKKKMVSLDELREAGYDVGVDKREVLMDRFDGGIALDAVNAIEPIYRDVIVMRFVEELTIKEIAKVLKEKENNVSVRLHRGMEKLRQLLNENEQTI